MGYVAYDYFYQRSNLMFFPRSTLLVLGLVFCQSALAQTAEQDTAKTGAQRVTGGALEKLYLGHVVSGKTANGYQYKTPVQADGHIKANKKRGAGKFSIIDDLACMTFEGLGDKKPLWDGKPMCRSVYALGDGKYKTFRPDGSPSADVEFLPLK